MPARLKQVLQKSVSSDTYWAIISNIIEKIMNCDADSCFKHLGIWIRSVSGFTSST